MSFPALTIAEAILAEAQARGVPVDPMQLQKLVFYTYAHHRTSSGQRLFPEPIEAWKFGPVIGSIYREFKAFADQPITSDFTWPKLTPAAVASILIVVNLYLATPAPTLSKQTHDEDPYKIAFALGQNTPINDDNIARFYRTHELNTPMISFSPALHHLAAQGVLIANESEVLAYLEKFPHLEGFTNALIGTVAQTIADPKEIEVEVYHDPEINQHYLNILVRQPKYDDLGSKLDRIWDKTYQELRPNLRNGTVNLMTDFCQPKTAAA